MFKYLMVSLTVLGAVTMPLLCAAPAQAQVLNFRSWISGTGDNNNPCTRTLPCGSWAGALAKTLPSGEIDALDPGDFGPVTITKSITLDGGGGQVAASNVSSNGIVVNAQPSDVIVIRNVRLQGFFAGANLAGLDGIQMISGGRLIVDNCDITGFANNGVLINGAGAFVAINNTRIENVGNVGILVVAPSGSPATVKVNTVHIYTAKFGVAISTGNTVFVSHSEVSNASAAGVEADGGALLVLNDNDITFNAAGIGGGGSIRSFDNNRLINAAPGVTPTVIGSTTNPTGMQ